jgi:hypothetical protein
MSPNKMTAMMANPDKIDRVVYNGPERLLLPPEKAYIKVSAGIANRFN